MKENLLSRKVVDAVEAWSVKQEHVSRTVIDYRKYTLRKWTFIVVCLIVTFMIVGGSVVVGAYNIGFFESYAIIWEHITGNIVNATKDYIVVELRLPRIIMGIIAGAGLAVAGAVMQSILLNPLADPYTTGVSSGASFGATLAITLGMTVANGHYAIVANAFIFSLIPTAMIVLVSRLKHTSPTVMIMAGIAVMYIFNAFTTVLMLWTDPNSLDEVYQWQVGSLSNATWEVLPLMGIVVLFGIISVQILSGKLNVLATGDDSARALGINAARMRTIALVIVAIMSAVVVSFTGLIGFVGLVAPHIVRIFIGPDNRFLIPASAAFGAALLIAADVIGRIVISPSILPVGVITAFMGGPLFLWLVVKKDTQIWG
ncbi:MAG: iron ABC transporter permease [archaeon]|nr:iron ABC transporter permease [archaeon]